MKFQILMSFVLGVSLLTGCECEKCEHHSEHKQERLMAEAKISKEDAQKTARARVPNGTIKEAELEKEHGKLIWSFDMTTPDSKDTTEVNVDAMTGAIVSVDKESPESEKKEAKEEKEKN